MRSHNDISFMTTGHRSLSQNDREQSDKPSRAFLFFSLLVTNESNVAAQEDKGRLRHVQINVCGLEMGHGRQQTWRHVCTIHLQRFLPDRAWENHFPPLSQPRPQKCEKMLLGNLACTMIMGFFIFWYSTPNPSLCLSPTLYWNVLSKYFGIVVRALNMDSLWSIQRGIES